MGLQCKIQPPQLNHVLPRVRDLCNREAASAAGVNCVWTLASACFAHERGKCFSMTMLTSLRTNACRCVVAPTDMVGALVSRPARAFPLASIAHHKGSGDVDALYVSDKRALGLIGELRNGNAMREHRCRCTRTTRRIPACRAASAGLINRPSWLHE